MSDYWLGVLSVPVAVAVLMLCLYIAKAGYLLLGLLGKVGIARFGSSHPDARYTFGAVIASSARTLIINKGSTGVIFFTGRAEPDDRGHINRLTSAMHQSEREDGIGRP